MNGPVADRAAAAALAAALRRLDYVEETVDDLVHEDGFSGGAEEVLVAERRLPRSRLGTAVRLLALQLPVARADAVVALGRKGVDALAATGLAEVGADVIPRSRLVPVGDLFLASDGFTKAAEDPPDWVAGYTLTGRTCDLLTPRARGRRALDVGAGSGIHALLAAQHHREVVAVDVNERALAYTALNAALNGFDNIECRRGSYFDPVADESFDLIACNAPFVISPEQKWAYRDSGLRGDDLTAQLVAAAAAHLAPGGYATMLGSWLVLGDDDSEARPVEWVRATGCDGWVLAEPESDPLDHASEWNKTFYDDPSAYAAVIDEWTAYLARLGARGVAEGAILLHRREGRTTVRVDFIDAEELEPAGAQVRRAFENRARLAVMRRDDLARAKLARAMPIIAERGLGRSRGTLLIDAGTNSTLPASDASMRIVERLDGATTLTRLGADRAALSLCRTLLELGALRFAA